MRKACVILLLFLAAQSAWAQEPASRVAVAPFTVRGQQDEQSTRRAIEEVLIRQLSVEGVRVVDLQDVSRQVGPRESVQTEEQSRALGRKLQADYVLMGSFNQVGNVISLDARLVDVSGRKKTESLFAEERGMENLAAATNQLIQQMAVHLMAKAVIAEVKIRGNERIEAEAIKANIKSKKGELLRPEQMREDIRSIYAMGFFVKVDAEVSDSPAGKVLTFVVEENPTVQEVKVKGASKIKEKDVLAAIATRAYGVLQRSTVSEDVQKIIKLYHQKGYFNAVVESSIDFPKDPRKAVVTFDIKENKKLYIKKINFTGNEHFSARKLRGVMQTKGKGILSWFTDRGVLQRDILETDIDRLTVFYHDRGYMDAKVGSPDISRKEDGFVIQIPIDEGQRYKISSVKLTGDPLEGKTDLSKKLASEPKEHFSREDLRKDIDKISKAYMDEGYAHAQVNPEIKRDPSSRTTDITFNVQRDGKVHIGRIEISGNTKTRDKVIRREIKLAEGETFSATKMEQSIQNLKKLDYFEDVEILPVKTDQSGVMNLQVKVKEKPTNSISVGGGFSSDDGLFASGEIVARNFLGRGQTLGVKAYLGALAQRYMLSYTEPWLFDTHLSAGIDVYNLLREYEDFTKDATGVRLRGSYPFGEHSRITGAYNLENAKLADVDYYGDVVDSHLLGLEEGWRLKSSVSLGVERDTTDHPFLPTKGSLTSLSTEISSQYLGSDTDFVRTVAHSGIYIPLFWKFIGFVRGEAGYIYTDNVDELPIYERFFLGGINSLRGFEFGEVGPKQRFKVRKNNPTEGDRYETIVVGGTTYGLANFELLFPLIEKLGVRGVVFFDAGNVYRDTDQFSVSSFRTDVGAGVRWNSPFGPLRFEWGYNLDPRPDEDQFQWQFSAGAFF